MLNPKKTVRKSEGRSRSKEQSNCSANESFSTPRIDKKYLNVQNDKHKNLLGKLQRNNLFDFKLPTIEFESLKVRKAIPEKKKFSVNPFPKLGSGHGIYCYENKFFRYEGQWRNGLKHGQGKLQMSDGSYYSGQFINGEIDGQGFRYFSHTKDEYTGDFRKGEMHGKGRMVYCDGSIYEGQWYRNRKHGYGIMRTSGPESYEGGYLGDMRDGYGLMLYRTRNRNLGDYGKRNGDQYEGYWKNDVRVGRGILKFNDGSIYDGEFIGDQFHGRGLMKHISGIEYNGEWINGFPRKMSTKVVIVIEVPEKKKTKKKEAEIPEVKGGEETEKKPDKMIIRQGVGFKIKVECRNEKDELIEDQGRELRLSAGFRYYPPVKSDDSALFDMIEDMEEKPIETPFGYSVVPYPITDQLNINSEELEDLEAAENDELQKSQTDLQGDENPENEGGEGQEETGEEKGDPEKADDEDGSGEENTNNSNENLSPELQPSVPLPPPVPHRRTHKGECLWEELHLAPAPPGYRAFKAKEEFEREETLKRSRSKEGRLSRQNTVTAPDITPTPSFSRRSSKVGGTTSRSGSNMFEKFRQNKRKALEEKFAKTGEYVLMVHDVTTPPYLDKTLTPAFLLLKLKQPEVEKRKDNRTKWSTEDHIRQSMRESMKATETSS